MSKGNLVYQVYFATFDKPRYVSEIGKLLYGEGKPYPTLIGKDKTIERCKELDLILEDKSTKMPENGSTTSYHFKKRDYYIANSSILVREIKNKLANYPDKELSSNEEKILEYLFNHDSFRKFIGVLLFRQEEGKDPVFMKEYATLEIVIQFLAFLSSYISVSLKTNGETIKNPFPSKFKTRFTETLEKGRRIERKGMGFGSKILDKMYLHCQDNIERKITREMFSEHKTDFDRVVSSLSDDHFFEAFLVIGSNLLNKLACISTLNDWIKLIHVSSAASSILQTYLYLNVDYSKEIGKKELPALLASAKPLLDKFGVEFKKQSH